MVKRERGYDGQQVSFDLEGGFYQLDQMPF